MEKSKSILATDILDSIDHIIERKNIYRKLFGLFFVFSCLFFLSVYAIYITSDIAHSGFFDYFSLIFSDWKIVFSHLGEFAISLINSVPFFEITLVTFSIFFLLVSAKFLIEVREKFNYK